MNLSLSIETHFQCEENNCTKKNVTTPCHNSFEEIVQIKLLAGLSENSPNTQNLNKVLLVQNSSVYI